MIEGGRSNFTCNAMAAKGTTSDELVRAVSMTCFAIEATSGSNMLELWNKGPRALIADDLILGLGPLLAAASVSMIFRFKDVSPDLMSASRQTLRDTMDWAATSA
ncbi:hypothetical protein [Singulisphaera sp. PoT]|uniref:hypothetical protein n=1 Tax=Singulisphaera sp. PoT TaxID=3411797 RepID=UPI003BF5EF38